MKKMIAVLLRGLAPLTVLLSHGAVAAVPKADVAKAEQFDTIGTSGEELALVVLKTTPTDVPVVHVAARFKGSDDKGRPDVFGPPGKPDIGPPGRSGY
jgi:hypothetical protein